jgi:hypothetical protein
MWLDYQDIEGIPKGRPGVVMRRIVMCTDLATDRPTAAQC